MSNPYPTFLMLDIEGSSKIARSLSRQEYLERVNIPVYAELKRLIALHQGEMSGTPRGDDALVVFANVNDAIECAVAIQKSLPKLIGSDTSEGAHRIVVRITVHTARKQVQPDENGLYPNAEDVIFTARMLVNVYGGQIVASDETHRVADSLQWNWQAWPNRRIKSFEEKPYTIHELLYEGWTSREPGSQFVPGWFREKNHYVSRPELENSVADCFARRTGNNNPYRLVTLHGFGGMGKTRLAMQCCLNAAGMFEGQLFLTQLDGIPDSALTSDLARRDYLVGSIARTFGLADPPATPENLPERLPNNGIMLLLLDNYETVKGAASARLIVDMLEARPDLRLLVTGRTPVGLTTGESVQDVEGLQPGEARDLLLTRIGEKKNQSKWLPSVSEEPTITTILEQTAYIPLALELVAAHCGDMTLEEIAAGLSLEPLGEMTETPDGMYSLDPSWRHQTLVKCYNWSWRLLDEDAQFALVCLSLFADRCPIEEITACFDTIKRPHLTRLQQAALTTRQEAGGRSVYSLLRPTRLYARKCLKESDEENIVQRHFVAYYRQIARENGGSENTEDEQKRVRLESAWRHAMSAADIAGELEDAEAGGDIADRLIHFVHRQALWAEGTFLYTLSLDVRRKALPEGHPQIATSLNNLAELYRLQGRYAEAEPLYIQALDIFCQAYSKQNPHVAGSLNNLALLYKLQGHYAKAEPLYVLALDIRRKALPDGHPDIAQSLNNLAELYRSQGRYGDAEPLCVQALVIDRVALGEKHPIYATGLNNLAGLYVSQGRYAEAEPLFKQALDIKRQNLSKDHPSFATSLNNLAEMYRSQGRYAEAEPLYVLALDVRRKALPDGHPDIAQSLNNLALLYMLQGRYGDAEPLYVLALDIRRKALPNGHPDIAQSLNNLATLYWMQGCYTEAEPLYVQALDILVTSLGPRHPDTVGGLNNFLTMLVNQERIEDARAFLAAEPELEETLALLLAQQSA